MLTDTERRMLTEQGLEKYWHTVIEIGEDIKYGHLRKCSCGVVECNANNRTFTHAQDYEDLLEKVVRPNKKKFSDFMWNMWISNWENTDTEDFFSWFLTLSIEERCKLIHDFGMEVLGWK